MKRVNGAIWYWGSIHPEAEGASICLGQPNYRYLSPLPKGYWVTGTCGLQWLFCR